ncbi:MAG: DUF3515 family protein [Micrococcales bacterium]
MSFSLRTLVALAAIPLALVSITACTSTVALEPAADSNNPACAAVTVRLPDEIGGNQKRETNAQATGAWGNPSAVLLRCGLPAVEASTLLCVTAGGVDWLVDDTQKPSYRFISFGRKPAAEVIVDSKKISGVTALDALGPAVQQLPSIRSCEEPTK